MHPESWGLQIVTQVAKPGCSEPEFSAVPTHAIDLNEEMAEVLSILFTSIFNGNLFSHISWVNGLPCQDHGSKFLPLGDDQVHEHMRNLNILHLWDLMRCITES